MNLARQIPNILSTLRIILALLILIVAPNKALVFVIMLLCGITDVLDGYIARKHDYQSHLGARLDSAGDYALFIILVAYFLIWQIDLVRENLILISVILIIRISSLVVSLIRNKKVYSLHTIANKITGVVVFLGITITFIVENRIVMEIVLIVALLSAIEELTIMVSKDKPDVNTKSIFGKRKDP